jgi:uncharacterized protein YciW
MALTAADARKLRELRKKYIARKDEFEKRAEEIQGAIDLITRVLKK